jgi:thiol-disulfide isomerase/thioredoxin
MFASETKERDWNQLCDESGVDYAFVWIHADWCAPCRQLEPEVKSMCENNSLGRWIEINVPQDEIEKADLKDTWGFTTIPIFFVYDRKEETWKKMDWITFKEFATL